MADKKGKDDFPSGEEVEKKMKLLWQDFAVASIKKGMEAFSQPSNLMSNLYIFINEALEKNPSIEEFEKMITLLKVFKELAVCSQVGSQTCQLSDVDEMRYNAILFRTIHRYEEQYRDVVMNHNIERNRRPLLPNHYKMTAKEFINSVYDAVAISTDNKHTAEASVLQQQLNTPVENVSMSVAKETHANQSDAKLSDAKNVPAKRPTKLFEPYDKTTSKPSTSKNYLSMKMDVDFTKVNILPSTDVQREEFDKCYRIVKNSDSAESDDGLIQMSKSERRAERRNKQAQERAERAEKMLKIEQLQAENRLKREQLQAEKCAREKAREEASSSSSDPNPNNKDMKSDQPN